MPPRGESPERLIVNEPPVALEIEQPALVKDEKLSAEGLAQAAIRNGIPPETATWEQVANAVAKKNGLVENYADRKAEYLSERAIQEGLPADASEPEILQARMARLNASKKSERPDVEEELPQEAA